MVRSLPWSLVLVVIVAVTGEGRADPPPAEHVPPRHLHSVASSALWKSEPAPAFRGPFFAIDEVCAELGQTQRRFDFAENDDGSATCDGCTFECRAEDVLRLTSGLPYPLSEVVLFRSASTAGDQDNVARNHTGADHHREAFLNAALRIEENWYVAADLDGAIGSDDAFTIESLESHIVPEGEGEGSERRTLILRYTADSSISEAFLGSHESVLVIGADLDSRLPVVRGPLLLAATEGVFTYGKNGSQKLTTRKRSLRVRQKELVLEHETTEKLANDKLRARSSKPIAVVRVPL